MTPHSLKRSLNRYRDGIAMPERLNQTLRWMLGASAAALLLLGIPTAGRAQMVNICVQHGLVKSINSACVGKQIPLSWSEVGGAGLAGAQGPQGAGGVVGPAGSEGAQGVAGNSGPTGPIGLQGPPGPVGPSGPQGLQGAAGPVGPLGPSGPQGLAGIPAVNSVVISGGLGGSRLSSFYGTTLHNTDDTCIGAGNASDLFVNRPSEYSPLPSGGTLSNFRVQLSTNPTGPTRAGDSFFVGSCTVPSPTTNCGLVIITCTVIGPDTSCSDTSHTVTLTAGQLIFVDALPITGSENTIPGASWSATYTH